MVQFRNEEFRNEDPEGPALAHAIGFAPRSRIGWAVGENGSLDRITFPNRPCGRHTTPRFVTSSATAA